jgi:uncharacterized protein (DUF433 family)
MISTRLKNRLCTGALRSSLAEQPARSQRAKAQSERQRGASIPGVFAQGRRKANFLSPAVFPLHSFISAPALDIVYNVNDSAVMATVVQSCRLEKEAAELLVRQAKRRQLEVSTLSSLYLKEKALEEEFPGIGFRDAAAGREACVVGHRVAVWEVLIVYREAKTVARTAAHFGWPDYLVKCALAYANAFPQEIARQYKAEVAE